MKKFILSHLVAIALVALSLTTFGCVQPTSAVTITSPTLVGTWVNSSSYAASKYVITTTSLDNTWTPTGGTTSNSYAGDNLCVVPLTSTSGTIFIKYTRSMNSDFTYSSTAPDVGKWYAISYKDLTYTSVKISGAYKSNGATSKDSLQEAISEFTIENGYFATYSECTKE